MSLKTQSFQFGDFLLDVKEKLLLRDKKPVPLTPKAFLLLQTLVENHGHLVEKDRLMKTVWPDSFVEEGNLSFTINLLRKALADNKQGPRFIETVPKRGYRFIADVQLEEAENRKFPAASEASIIELDGEHLSPVKIPHSADQFTSRHSAAVVALSEWRHNEPAEPSGEKSSTSASRLELVPIVEQKRSFAIYVAAAALCAVFLTTGSYFFRNQIFGKVAGLNSLASRIGVLSAEKLTDTGNVKAASISPDGRMLAYVTVEGGGHVVWLRQLATGKSVQIVPQTDKAITSVNFSRDGEHLLYVSRPPTQDSHLSQIPILGGTPRIIISKLHGYTVSPDGRSIAFTRFSAQGNSLMLTDSDGKNERTLLSISPLRHIISLSWSPGGKAIAYGVGKMSTRDNDFAVMEFNLETGEERSLTDFRWNVVEKVSWLPDGSGMLVSGRNVPDANDQIWLLTLADASVRQISFDSSSLYLYNASDDLTKIVASQSSLDTQIWVSPSNAPSSPQPMIAARYDLTTTPDGKIVFPANDAVGTDIWIMNRDGTDRRQLTQDASVERNPVISPDGRFMVFVSGNGGKQNIWRMDLAGGSPVQLTNGDGEHFPDLTPDGRFVVYNSLADGSVWQVSVEGGEPVKVFGERAMRVSVSPDGKKFAYFGRKDERRKLIVRSFLDGAVLHEFDATIWIASPPRVMWERDGRSLIYPSSNLSVVGNLMRQPLDGSPPQQLTDFTSLTIFDFCVSTEGHFTFVRGAWKFDVVLLAWSK